MPLAVRSPAATPRGRHLLHRLFVALYPPPETAATIARLVDRTVETGEMRGRRVPGDRLHISLNYLGGFPEPPYGVIEPVIKALSSVQARAFVVALDRVVSFGAGAGLRPRVLTGDDGLIGVFMLHHAIHAALVQAGLTRRTERPFTPHLTLSREAGALPEDFIDPVVWRVQEFRLIHSREGEGRHHAAGVWSLPDRETELRRSS
jgi:2'-5' RNA ligase